MDCCNYVEAYAAGNHFYQQQQQQHYFCYDNLNSTAYAGYEPQPIANGIGIPRYNGALPPAYPTDYVYNPKEARLRKAMREQSRELTRRSILQNAIGRAAAGGVASTASTAGFLEHQHPFGCAPSPVPSSLPMQNAERLAEPWFSTKPTVHSPRLTDWYGQPAADPIERLQAMGTMHQRAVLDKCKDAIRSQHANNAECTVPYSGPTYSEFNGRDVRRQESLQDYAEFPEGQKWHPYQNGASSHQHPRTPHPSQLGGILHPSIQNTSPHSHGHGPWSQFCHGVLPHVSGMSRNVGIRGPRHAVFLRDHPGSRHCGFPEEISRLPYTATKLDVDAVRTPYPPTEHQMPRLIESPTAPVIESSNTAKSRRSDEDEENRWESSNVSNNMPLDTLVPTSTSQEPAVSREKAQATRRTAERFETTKKKTASKQPLPGFHQAFGSTEIGKFSRSEYFVSMVGESSAVEADNSDVSTEHRLEMNDTTTAASAADSTASVSATTSSRSFESEESEEASFDENHSELVSYCGQPTAPRWHSPHVGPIGSEI